MEILLDMSHINKSSLGSSITFKSLRNPDTQMFENCWTKLFSSNKIVLALSGYTEQMFISFSCPDNQATLWRQLSFLCWLSNQPSDLVVLLPQHMASPIAAAEEKAGRRAHQLLNLLLSVTALHSSLIRTDHRAPPNCKWAGKCEKVAEYLVSSKCLYPLQNKEVVVRNWSSLERTDGEPIVRWSRMQEKAGEICRGQTL